MKLPVSCFIIAYNEADRIVRTVRAIRDLVDEVIVVDSGSSDGTPELCAAEGARVVHNDWPGFGAQKRFGEALCRNDWILNIDADEVVTPELAAELRGLFADGKPPDVAFGVWVQIVYPGWSRPRWLAKDHYCVRLYDRRRIGFKDSALHDSVDTQHYPVRPLKGWIHHYSFRSLADLAAKCKERADVYALHTKPKPHWQLALRAVAEFPIGFVKYYLGRRHFTGGRTGLRVALIYSQYRRARIVRARHMQHRRGLAGAMR